MDGDPLERLNRLAERIERGLDGPQQEWFPPAGIAKICNVDKRVVLAAIRRRELPAANVAQGEQPHYRVHVRDADAWMRSKMLPGAGDTRQQRDELVKKFFGRPAG
jgi:hypothetical protein